nr:hypothetical protein Iba_chr01bCG5500 [Ipomoea batatas]GMC49192.1 hypothetical protein Iba_chr01bCG5530 [Ipomoea batatas]
MVPTKSLLNCNSIDLENFVLIKVQFKADLTDPDLEQLSITREEAEDVLDFNREHPRNPAKRRRFDQTSLNFVSTLYRYLFIVINVPILERINGNRNRNIIEVNLEVEVKPPRGEIAKVNPRGKVKPPKGKICRSESRSGSEAAQTDISSLRDEDDNSSLLSSDHRDAANDEASVDDTRSFSRSVSIAFAAQLSRSPPLCQPSLHIFNGRRSALRRLGVNNLFKLAERIQIYKRDYGKLNKQRVSLIDDDISAACTGECKGGGRWADDCLFGGMDMRLGSLHQVRLREVG